MSLLISSAYAQGAGGAPGRRRHQPDHHPGGVRAVFYFLLIRPAAEAHEGPAGMLSRLASGDEVVTTGGILGRITEVGDQFRHAGDRRRRAHQGAEGQITQLMPKGTLKSA